jgi:hypothetical protein
VTPRSVLVSALAYPDGDSWSIPHAFRSSDSSAPSPSPCSCSERTPERSHGPLSTGVCTRRVSLRRSPRRGAGRTSRPRYAVDSERFNLRLAHRCWTFCETCSEESSVPTLPPSWPSETPSLKSETLPDRPPSPRLRRRSEPRNRPSRPE